jgi:hypothetical protein
MNSRQTILLLAALAFRSTVMSQVPSSLGRAVGGPAPAVVIPYEGAEALLQLRFDGAVHPEETPDLPIFAERIPLPGPGRLQAVFQSVVYEPLVLPEGFEGAAAIPYEMGLSVRTEQERRTHAGWISFVPIRRTGSGGYERVVSFTLRLSFEPQTSPPVLRGGNTYTSVLSTGNWYKIAVERTGVHRLDYAFLKNELGIPVDDIDPRQIRLFGYGGGILPEVVGAARPDDLPETAIHIAGEADGRFHPEDYLLFYGEGPDALTYDPVSQNFRVDINHYETRNYYFLQTGGGTGARVQDLQAGVPGSYQTAAFDEVVHYEQDRYNLQHDWVYGQGAGQSFYGDYFKVKTEGDYSEVLQVPGIVPGEPARLSAVFAARVSNVGGSSRFSVTANGETFSSATFSTTKGGSTDTYAHQQSVSGIFTPVDGELDITLEFSRPDNNFNEGWLDFITLNLRRQLRMTTGQLAFRDTRSAAYPTARYDLDDTPAQAEIWDVTDPRAPVRPFLRRSGDRLSFDSPAAGVVRAFIAFDRNGDFPPVTAVGAIPNQNLHGFDGVDMAIVHHAEFSEQAARLARHRESHSGLTVALVEVGQLYNEFSSGRKDATAIRDFARMLYDRNPERFRSLLLFGDGSFDARDIYGLGGDFVPVYETPHSLSPIYSFPSDDYFALLDPEEGGDLNTGALDIGVGRFPVKTAEEARLVVDKVIHYDTHAGSLRDWRNRVVFVGDDEDGNLHTGDADDIAVHIGAKNPNLNIDKVYLDAFPQEATFGGVRVPLATDAINNSIFKGILAMVFLGHGGSKGWTQERVLKIEDILSWDNQDRLPIIITATCSFSGYDDPSFTSAGEQAFLNGRGGAIALYTTVRPVFASANKKLTEAAVDTLFYKFDHAKPGFGEVLRLSKNKSGNASNSRKFTLLGDPAQQLALPVYNIVTTELNGIPVDTGRTDTLRALQKVTVAGEIRDDFGNLLTDFNGIVYPTVFDKKVVYQTLAQDAGSPLFNFDLQKNVVFKGRASVREGRFRFTFIVPRDIDYNYGIGKISYYAADESRLSDAAGQYRQINVGGSDTAAVSDGEGPEVEVYLNNENFVFGGITNENPVLLVHLSDDNGINVIGNSVGHDLAGVLDQDTRNTYLLNDFYEAAVDDYTRGTVRYPLYKIPAGRHEIKVRAWDVANNPAEGLTEFVVASSEKAALRQVLNYPNPFTTQTCFQFEHNQAGFDLDVSVHIYTISGRLIKTLQERIFSTSHRLGLGDCIQWDGRDDFGDALAKGVYLYKVRIRAMHGGGAEVTAESDFEKLVILR